MTEPNPEQRRHKHRRGDQYRAVFGDFQGNPTDGYTHEYWWLGPLRASWVEAKRDGFQAQDSDDFNIGVIRKGELTATLWMHDIVDDEPDVMAEIVASAGTPGGAW